MIVEFSGAVVMIFVQSALELLIGSDCRSDFQRSRGYLCVIARARCYFKNVNILKI